MHKHTSICLLIVGVAMVFTGAPRAFADGTEGLGPASIGIASGSGIVAAGTGLAATQPGTIDIDVPGEVVQALLYWEGFMSSNIPGDDTISVNGNMITGTLVGGPTTAFGGGFSSAYRAEITSLVSSGPNTLMVEGLEFTTVNNGAGLLVIFDDGSGIHPIDVRDGVDLAFRDFAPPRDTTVPQTFTFEPADTDRAADLAMFFSAIAGEFSTGGPLRPTVVEIMVGGVVIEIINQLTSADGEEWDTMIVPLTIPAGADSLTVQALSEDLLGTGELPASFNWLAAGLSMEPPPPPPSLCWLTAGGVKFESVTRLWSAQSDSDGRGGPKDTVGGVAYPSCSQFPSNGGQWNHVAHSLKLHLIGEDIRVLRCGNVEGIEPGSESPVCAVNFIEFEGTGRLKGLGNNRVDEEAVFFVRAEDHNEPGNEQSAKSGADIDRYFLRVMDLEGNVRILVDVDGDPATVDPLTITGGNLQIHCTSCDTSEGAGASLEEYGHLFIRGDANTDGQVDISDPLFSLNHLYLGGSVPACEDAADANDDGALDLSDAVYTLSFLFSGGPAMPAPFSEPWKDRTVDFLTCTPWFGE